MKRRYSILIIASAAFFATAQGLTARAVEISASIPGGTYDATSTGIGAYVGNFYQFALWAGGILAFGIIVFGGVKYMISMGNPSNQEDAKEWIKAALLGVLLLAGAYFILNVVNPQLVNLSIPALTKINLPTSTSGGTGGGTGGGNGGSTGSGTCAAGVCTGNNTSNNVPNGTLMQGVDSACPKTNACGADGGACSGDCASGGQICAASGPNVTANNTSPSGSTLPWHCIPDSAYGQ